MKPTAPVSGVEAKLAEDEKEGDVETLVVTPAARVIASLVG